MGCWSKAGLAQQAAPSLVDKHVPMGIFKGMSNKDPKQLELAVADAREAWDCGFRCYVYKPSAMASLDGKSLTWVLDKMIETGWVLHSTALAFNSTGINTEQGMFTFVRPPDGSVSVSD